MTSVVQLAKVLPMDKQATDFVANIHTATGMSGNRPHVQVLKLETSHFEDLFSQDFKGFLFLFLLDLDDLSPLSLGVATAIIENNCVVGLKRHYFMFSGNG